MLDLTKLSKPELKQAVSETLKVFKMLSEDNYNRIKAEMEDMKSESELEEYLINPLNIYMEPFNEIPKTVIDDVIKAEGIIITEKFHIPHVFKDENGVGILTNKAHVAFPLPVRANQQKSFKEGKSAKSSTQRNIANQVTGESKSGTFSDTEIVTTTVHGGDDILKELLGPASHDLVAFNELKGEIIKTGEGKLSALTNDSKNKGSLLYMDQILKAMGFDSDIIEPPEK